MNKELTDIFKNIIKQNGLVNSGKLLKSIAVFTTLKGFDLSINIVSEPYLIYLNNDYKLTKQFIDNEKTNNVIRDLISEPYIKLINDIVNGKKVNSRKEPTVMLLINGL
jgi:hypothetical protein